MSIYVEGVYVVYAAPGPYGGWTFYRRLKAWPSRKGQRVRTRPSQWYATRDEAEAALQIYASKRGWRKEEP